MTLEFRNKSGNLFAKVSGESALYLYRGLEDSRYFKKEINTFTNKGQFTCFVCVDYSRLDITNEFELQFDPNDYIKVIL